MTSFRHALPALVCVLAGNLGACHGGSNGADAPLPPDLAAVQCPANANGHVSAPFGKARVSFACVDPDAFAKAGLLHCDASPHAQACDRTMTMVFTRDAHGIVHSGAINWSPADHGPGPGPTDNSMIEIAFDMNPQRQDKPLAGYDAPYYERLPDTASHLPTGFSPAGDALCQPSATVLDSGICSFQATTPSLHRSFTVTLHHPKDTSIPQSEYLQEIDGWMKYLPDIVADPALQGH